MRLLQKNEVYGVWRDFHYEDTLLCGLFIIFDSAKKQFDEISHNFIKSNKLVERLPIGSIEKYNLYTITDEEEYYSINGGGVTYSINIISIQP